MNLNFPIFLLFLFSFNVVLVAQENEKEVYLLFDDIVGLENTVLSNGIENIDLQKTLSNNNKYFLSQSKFESGSVVYDNQYFPNVSLKYNVIDDELIISIPNGKSNSTFELVTEKVSSFTLSNHKFEYIKEKSDGVLQTGFYEVLYEKNTFNVLKKYIKSSDKKMDRSYLYFNYEFDEPDYFFSYNGSYYKLDSWRDLSDLFPDLKKEIRIYFKKYNLLQKTDRDTFTIQLFQEISRQITQDKP